MATLDSGTDNVGIWRDKDVNLWTPKNLSRTSFIMLHCTSRQPKYNFEILLVNVSLVNKNGANHEL